MNRNLIKLALSALVATGLIGASFTATAADMNGKEKCYGVAKAGQNDCGTSAHECSGHATKDGMQDEWVFAPKGLCDKLVGGSTTKPA